MNESENVVPEAPIVSAGSQPEPTAELDSRPASESEPVRDSVAVALQPEPEPPVESTDSPMLAVLDKLEERFDENQRLLARQTDIAASLHAENQILRAGELRRAQLPLVRDLIRVQDVLGRALGANVESTAAADLQIAQDSIIDALARNGIEAVLAKCGDALDPRVHKVVDVEPVDDPAADRTIAEVVKTAFAWDDGTAIRAADVRVYKHTPAGLTAHDPNPEPNPARAQPPQTEPE